jgi:hypothetical protein
VERQRQRRERGRRGIERLHLGLYSVPIGWIAAWAIRALLTQWKLRDGAWMRRAPLAA